VRATALVVLACACVPEGTLLDAPPEQPQASRWSTRAPIPQGRSAAAAGVLDGRLYVAGGYANGGLARVDAYDALADTWSQPAPLPATRHTDAPAATVGARLYVAGGSIDGQCTTLVTAYDPTADAWTPVSSMPGDGRCWAAVAAVGDTIYVLGGTNTMGSLFWQNLLAFDTIAGSWGLGVHATVPTPRTSMAVAVHDGRIYTMGGYTGEKVDVVEIYDPEADVWESAAAMPTARTSACAQVLDGRIHVVGGQLPGLGEATGVHEIFDPARGTWSEGEPLPTPRMGAACGVIDGVLFVAGGSDGDTTFGVTEAYTP
jgi:N-acetylneuraminic acid mutarotase